MLFSLSTMWVLFLLSDAIPAVSSETCEEHFRESNSCPPTPSSYKKLNDLCCGNNDRKKLHCISTHTHSPDGVSRVIYGCFNETVIPAGFAMNISPSSPREKQLIPCEGDFFYEPENRSSVDVRHNYCTRIRSKCSDSDMVRICQGGPTADDQCGCADEYEPCDKASWESFTDDHFACCEKTCPSGTARQVTRTVPLTCPFNSTVLLDYICHPVPSPATSSPKPPTESTPPKPSLAKANNLQWWHVLLGVLACIIVLLICFLIKKKERVTEWVKKRRGSKHTPPPNSPQPEEIGLVDNQNDLA